MNVSARSDEELALALQAGHEEAFDELVRRYQGRVYAVAYRITGNREDALDTAQEVFVKAYRKIASWRPTAGFGPWLMRIAANQAIDATRRGKRHRHAVLDEAQAQRAGEHAATPHHEDTARAAAAHEIGERVQAALGILSPSQRTVFVMRHYEGMALAEIAASIGCTEGSVKVHLYRAVRKLQGELRDLHGGFSDPE